MKVKKWNAVGSILLVVVLVVLPGCLDRTETTSPEGQDVVKEQVPEEVIPVFSVAEINSIFQADVDTANKQYAGEKCRITGEVFDFAEGGRTGRPCVIMTNGESLADMAVGPCACFFSKSDADVVEQMSEGDLVTIEGVLEKVDEDENPTVLLEKCKLVSTDAVTEEDIEAAEVTAASGEEAPSILTARRLYKEFEDNPFAAERKYEGKRFRFSGDIADIGKGDMFSDVFEEGAPIVSLEAGIFDVKCGLPKEAVDIVANLSEGDEVVMEGEVVGLSSGDCGDLIVKDAKFVD